MAKKFDKKKQQPREYTCSFCGGIYSEKDMILGDVNTHPRLSICRSCIDISKKIFKDREYIGNSNSDEVTLDFTPMSLKRQLDEYIVGQDKAKKIMSVAVYNHYKRVYKLQGEEIDKANVCLIGSSGCGKTLLAKTIAKLIKVPIVIADATTFTAAGYVGKNVEDCLMALVKSADGDIQKAEKGIVFIDEIDKIATRESNGKDIGGESVQQALLKMIEGTKMSLTSRRDTMFGDEEQITIDTSNILFVVSGSFCGIEKVINSKKKTTMGFGGNVDKPSELDEVVDKVTQEDLISFGMIPEFVGRIQTIATLKKLDEASMVKILTEPKNALIKQYQKLMKADGVTLTFDSNAIKKIANIAIKQKTGARSLKTILEHIMLDIMYKAPDETNKNIDIKEQDITYQFN